MPSAKFKPVQFARAEDVDNMAAIMSADVEAIVNRLIDAERHVAILETALLKVIQDNEAISDALVDAGLLEVDDSELEDESADEVQEDEGVQAESAAAYGDLQLSEGARAILEEDQERYEEALASGEGMPEPEDAEARAERIAAIRARREQAVKDQGLKAFEDANEDPVAAAAAGLDAQQAANMMTDVPDEGIIILSSSADAERYQ